MSGAAALCAMIASCGLVFAAPAKTAAKPAVKTPPPATAPAKAPAAMAMDSPMQVAIVRSDVPGCEPSCTEWIAAQGRIDASTPRKFKRVISQLGKRHLPIFIHSIGGSVDESLAIGRLIRAKGLDVAVTKTELTACAANDKACRKTETENILHGHPVAYRSLCASACAFLLAGGTHRFVSPRTLVGVHQMTSFETRVKLLRTYRIERSGGWFGAPVVTKKTLVAEKRIAEKTVETPTKDSSYRKVQTYFEEMGVTGAIMPLVMSASGKSIHWLTRAELRTTRMATDATDGEQLLQGTARADQNAPEETPAADSHAPTLASTYDPFARLPPCDGAQDTSRGCYGSVTNRNGTRLSVPVGLESDRLQDDRGGR